MEQHVSIARELGRSVSRLDEVAASVEGATSSQWRVKGEYQRAAAELRVSEVEEGLREAYTEALEELDLLRFTARHPALAKAAVDALLRMVKSEKQRSRRAEEQEAAAAAAAATVVEEEDGDNDFTKRHLSKVGVILFNDCQIGCINQLVTWRRSTWRGRGL